ncbi:MAG: YfcE family phosphodiesterase [Candidatus Verstraetearchaeota archaeon]|jgi:putative phosphoesterase|nr:YfcE family phosphodiesterase [Candidatus Verstraetearchaeota archaeon]
MAKRALAIGDFHIPERADWVPRELEDEVGRRDYDVVFCTGDLTSEDVLTWLKGLASEVYVVRGNMDYLRLPVQVTVTIEGLRVGVHHGSGVHPRGDVAKLALKAEQLGVEVLVTGHTHYPQVALVRERGVVIVNPGSATGVWGGDARASLTPSFATMEVSGRSLVVEVKELRGSKFEVSKFEFHL